MDLRARDDFRALMLSALWHPCAAPVVYYTQVHNSLAVCPVACLDGWLAAWMDCLDASFGAALLFGNVYCFVTQLTWNSFGVHFSCKSGEVIPGASGEQQQTPELKVICPALSGFDVL